MEKTNGEKLDENLSIFLKHIDSIKDTLPMTMLLMKPYNKKETKKYFDFINIEFPENQNIEEYEIDVEKHQIAKKLSKNALISSLAFKIIPESLFVSLISQYDAF